MQHDLENDTSEVEIVGGDGRSSAAPGSDAVADRARVMVWVELIPY